MYVQKYTPVYYCHESEANDRWFLSRVDVVHTIIASAKTTDLDLDRMRDASLALESWDV